MNNIRINLLSSNKSKTLHQVLKQLNQLTQDPNKSFKIDIGKLSLKTLSNKLPMSFDCTPRESVMEGCYGANTGKYLKGLTLWMDAEQFPTRYIDDQGDEVVNLKALIKEMGGELMEGQDGDQFEELCEDSFGLEVKRNNTYNYGGQSKDDPHFMYDADYAVIETEKACFLSIKFHCGGDVRGNYTSKVVYKFESIDDLYNCIYPSLMLKEEGE